LEQVPDPPEALLRLIAAESEAPTDASIVAVAEAARLRHGQAIVAVLFYGSCLRQPGDQGRMVDLYLLADGYAGVHRRRTARMLNALLPPNVYYLEIPFEGRRIAAKYAIVTLRQFETLVDGRTLQAYFWARFAQPTAILWARDDAIRLRVLAALGRAVMTMIGETRGLMSGAWTPAALWSRAFDETYRTELRAESLDQGRRLYQAFAERYDRVTGIVLSEPIGATVATEGRRAARRWRRRRVLGKALSVLRLVKASFTFEDGAAYLVWKIRRHSGVEIELTSWQRRHPVLASTVLAWRLYRAGGFR
jgi:hypothetical protein